MDRKREQEMQVIREAAEWNQRLKAGALDPAQRKEYRLWLQDPSHAHELAQMCLIDVFLQRVSFDHESAQHRGDNVIDFESYVPSRARVSVPAPISESTGSEPGRNIGSRFNLKKVVLSAAACVVAVVGILSMAVNAVTHETVMATKIGTWDRQLMEDGSVVYAGPNTELTFHMDDGKRAVSLIKGEAFFDVAKDPSKPFIVTTRLGSVRVVGTEFSTAYRGESVVVTVQEGKVNVTPKHPSDPAQPVIPLIPNQQVILSPSGSSVPAVINAAREIQWIRNWYESDGEMVCEIIQQLNQRHDVKIVADDLRVCRVRMSSLSFKPSEPQVFVEKVNKWFEDSPLNAGKAGSAALRIEAE